MQAKTIKNLVVTNLLILIPFVLYGIFKNGYLLYEHHLINFWLIFKPLYLVIIAFLVKLMGDLFSYHKFKIDYNLLCLILVALIMPYNINLLVFFMSLIILYPLSNLVNRYGNINKVCLIYLVIILINSIFTNFTYESLLESSHTFSFTYFDLLLGRSVGGISSTCILASLIIYPYLTFSIYYKKEIPLTINITYLGLMFIYYLVTQNSASLLNSDLIFASILICPLPEYSPTNRLGKIIYGVIIGFLAFLIAIFFNSTISIYLATLVTSLLLNFLIWGENQHKKLAKRA